MKNAPIKIVPRLLCIGFFALSIILACNKDGNEPYDAVNRVSTSDIKAGAEEKKAIRLIANATETRTTSFSPIQDAYVQSGIGYDQKIVRLEDGRRKSYLMFDLRKIQSNGGSLISADLEFTISSDGGNGTVSIFKGKASDWSEEKLSANTAPEAEALLAVITDDFKVGQTKRIRLDGNLLKPGIITLVLTHKNGNDLAFASKEHPDEKGSKLIVSYEAPVASGSAGSNTTEEEEDQEADNKSLVAVISGSPPSSGKAPLKVDFKAWNSKDQRKITGYYWDFGNGSKTTKKNPSHTFSEPGDYIVKLTVKNAQGQTHSTTFKIKVTASSTGNASAESGTNDGGGGGNTGSGPSSSESTDGDLVAVISGSPPSSGQAPLKVDFKAWNSKDQRKITGYYWDFGNGSTTTKKNPSHTFSEPGDYTVKLTVKNAEGQTHSTAFKIKVTASPTSNGSAGSGTNGGSGGGNTGSGGSSGESKNGDLVAVISGSPPSSGQAPLKVDFKAWNSKDQRKITGYFWDFGNGSTTTKKNPSHTFSNPGDYTVKLTVKNAEGQTHSTTFKIRVTASSTSSSGSNGGGSSGGSISNTGGNTGSNGNSGGNTNTGNYPSNAVFASSFGFKSGDATAAFEAALKSGSSYVVIDRQSSDWVIRPTKFFNLSNITVVFEPGVVLRAKSGAFGKSNAQLFLLSTPDNLTIEGNGATFQMNRSEYNSGEARHAVGIYGGRNVAIKGLTIKGSGGDGIFINRSSSRAYSEDINISDVTSENNRRMGMTVVSGKDIYVRNSRFSNNSGTLPEAGVTLEPDRSDDRLVNINFINCTFSGNDSSGLHLSTKSLNSGSTPISIKVLDSEFRNNEVSSTGTTTEVYLGGGSSLNPVDGEIRFERVKFNGSRGSIIFSRKSAKGFTAVFKDCQARNVAASSGSPIRLEALGTRSQLGGFRFDNFYIEYNSNEPFMHINAPGRSGAFKVRDIIGSFDIMAPNDSPVKYSGGYRANQNINVSIDIDHL